MSAQPFTEYRGCVILVYPGLDPLRYGSPCTVYLRWTVGKVKLDIDAYRDLVPEEPPEPPEPEPEYICPYCYTPFYTDLERTRHIELAHPPAPPTPPEDTFIETYRGYEIWRRPEEGMFYAEVTSLITAIGLTLAACRKNIDDYLKSLEPEEDPPTGLLAQITANIKSWVNGIIGSAISGVKTWVRSFVKAAIDAVDWVVTKVTQYIDNSVNYWGDVINKTFVDARQWIDNSVTNIDRSVHQYFTDARQYITNIIGITQEILSKGLSDNRDWVRAFFKLMDPMEFLRDPGGFIKAVFTVQGKLAETTMVTSFLEGFEEGLEE